MTTTPEARFGHHPDHIIDYAVEVECIQSMCLDYGLTGKCFGDDDRPASLDDLMRRIWRANGFRVGVIPEALRARAILRDCIKQMEPVYVS